MKLLIFAADSLDTAPESVTLQPHPNSHFPRGQSLSPAVNCCRHRAEKQQREQYHQTRPCATEKNAQHRPIDCQSTVKHLSVHNVHWRTVDCTVQVNNHDILWTVQITLTNREIDRTYGHFHRHQERTCELFCLFGLTTWQGNHKRFFSFDDWKLLWIVREKKGGFFHFRSVCVCVFL